VSQGPSRLLAADVARVAAIGLHSRPVRAALSALGIAIGVATLVSVLGVSAASRAHLLAQIDALGTNLLTVAPGRSLSGETAVLPARATAMIRRIGPVQSAAGLGDVNANVYRNDRIPIANTDALSVYAADPDLLGTVQGTLAAGTFLTAANSTFPTTVLGADAAHALGIDRADGTNQVWLGHHTFTVVGILNPLPLTPELDRSALIGFSIAEQLLHADGTLAQVYVRAEPRDVTAVRAVLAATANPQAPQTIATTNPADAVTARADANSAFHALILGLGGIALLVGGIGIANVMIISVLERRNEIGLRRSLGATRRHIAAQFTAESALLATAGGVLGVFLGSTATTIIAVSRSWPTHLSPIVAAELTAAAMLVGILAGVYPAAHAARLSPAEALRTT
jgi:putative ABC transport system permease protein